MMRPDDEVEVYLYRGIVDMRKSINGLSALVEQELGLSPFAPQLFVFCNRKRDKIKILYWERSGFGSKSEKIPAEQGRLFNEAEVEAAAVDDGGDAIAVPGHTRRRRGRRPLPDFLPVQEMLHDLSEDEKVCEHDSRHTLVEIGRETSDQLKFIPATVEIVRPIRPKYACPTCREGAKIAPMPKLRIPRSLATPSLLAHVATSKYVAALPLYRQEKIFQRLGVDVSRV